MKKILYIAIAILTASVFSSCNQDLLEIPQHGVMAYDDFYDNSPESAAAAAITCYERCGQIWTTGAGFRGSFYEWCIAPSYYVMTNAPSDDTYYGSGDKGDHVFGLELNEFRPSWSATSAVCGQVYCACYNLIRDCNILLSNFDGTDAVSAKARAEARFFRAMAHFILAEYWGSPVLVTEVLDGTERPENTPHDEVLTWCISEFDEAAKVLPSKSGVNDPNMAIHVTKELALAFKGKAQIWLKDWAGAKTSLKSVISSGKYALVPGDQMVNLGHMAGDGCSEDLFEINYVDFPGVRMTGKNHGQGNNACWWRKAGGLQAYPSVVIQAEGWGGGGNPSASFVEDIMNNEPNSYRRKAWIISYEELVGDFTYDDNKGGATKEERMHSPEIGLEPGGRIFGSVGYFSFKTAPRRADLVKDSDATTQENKVVMRYAEVLLLYAEACAMTNDSDGLQYLNMVAERAGAPTYSALTMDNVKHEKRLEMYLEGTRFADLVRWGDAPSVLGQQGKYVPSFRDKFDQTGVHEAYIDDSDAYYNTEYGFKTGKHELMPYPRADVVMNENLKQNPGWE